MERESFEDNEVAQLLNDNFVSIKVDREEMPDVDHLYMEVCTALTGHGGWPLSCFMTSDKKPFFAGTYFPKNDRYGITGFMSILKTISTHWKQDKSKLLSAADEIISHIGARNQQEKGTLNEDVSHTAFEQLKNIFDESYGGFGTSPKFPSTHNLLFLIRYNLLYKDKKAIEMVDKTLTSMYRGGIFDHIGGGFCRYSTDKRWLVPHFEKMMYDNAMLTIAYCEAGAVIDPFYFKVANRTLDYCISEMHHSEGGFYTAQDADSEGVEGKYYVFTPSDVEGVLGKIDGERFCKIYDITKKGNFEGQNIPNLIQTIQTIEEMDFSEYCTQKLYDYRKNRISPFKDDKLLTSVNGLMVVALSTAGRIMNHKKYVDLAENTANFILEKLFFDGRLYTGYREHILQHPATSDDYAYVLWGMFELYQATLNPKWLKTAIDIAQKMLGLFMDEKNQGLYLSGNDVEHVPIRGKNIYDGALPSGNSVAANVLARLAHITGDDTFANAANGIVGGVANDVNSYPTAFTGFLCADLYNHQGGVNINIVNGVGFDEMVKDAQQFDPFKTIMATGVGYDEVEKITANTQATIDGKATAYICTKGTCKPPITNMDMLNN